MQCNNIHIFTHVYNFKYSNIVTASDLCEEGQNNCSQICYMDPVNPGQAKCECNGGFVLGEDGKSCQGLQT